MNNQKQKKSEIIIYQPKEGDIELKISLREDTLWLTQVQIAKLFNIQRPAITKHLSNIFENKELKENSVCSKMERTASDGKTYKTKFYNLDAVIALGYRVNSKQATQFRIWATNILKKYIIQGYAINQNRLLNVEKKFRQLQEIVAFLQKKSDSKSLRGQEKELLDLLSDYSKTLTLLYQYDNDKLKQSKGGKSAFLLQYNLCTQIITELKKKLIDKKEAGDLFGNEVDEKFKGIVGNLYQTFNKKELYSSIEGKASHFLYLTIKDHPFSDGNKRIASFLFVYFLDRSNYLYRKNGERKINDNTLTALALLIAESNPKEKSQIVALISQLLK